MSDEGLSILKTVGEAGGISGIIAIVLMMLIKVAKKNGCTLRCYGCSGKPVVEVDCEEGAATERYLPKEQEHKTETNGV